MRLCSLLLSSSSSPLRLLFCHGLGSTKSDAHLVQEWARTRPDGPLHFQIVKYAHYGDPGHVWTVNHWMRDIVAELGRDPRPRATIAVCVSAGAQAMLRALQQSPDIGRTLSALLLVSPGVRMSLDNYIRRVLPALRGPLGAGLPVAHPSSDPTVRISIDLRSLEDYAQKCVLRSDRPFAPMHFPVRIVHGLHDKLVPFANSVELLERLPTGDKALHLVPCGHTITDASIVRYSLDSLWMAISRQKNEEWEEESVRPKEMRTNQA